MPEVTTLIDSVSVADGGTTSAKLHIANSDQLVLDVQGDTASTNLDVTVTTALDAGTPNFAERYNGENEWSALDLTVNSNNSVIIEPNVDHAIKVEVTLAHSNANANSSTYTVVASY